MIRGRNVRGIRGPGLLLAAAALLAIPIAASDPTADARFRLSAPTGTPTPGAPEPGDTLRLSAPAPSAPEAPPEPEFEAGLADAPVTAAQAVVSGGTELAVAVLDRATDETALGVFAAEPLYTASLSKLLVAVDLVERRRTESLVLDPGALDQLRRMLSASDDSAMSALWSRFDGAGAPGRVSARLGLQDTSAASDASQGARSGYRRGTTCGSTNTSWARCPRRTAPSCWTHSVPPRPRPATASTRTSGSSPPRSPAGSGPPRSRAGCAASPGSTTCTAPGWSAWTSGSSSRC